MTEPTTCTVPVEFLRGVIALCTQRGYSPENIEAWSKDDKWVADLWRQAEQMLAIAKWDTPAPVGVEPYGYVYAAQVVTRVGDEHKVIQTFFTQKKPPWEALPLYTTPQPTQAQAGAVPLTVDEVEQLIAQWSYELHGDRARYLVRMTEQHHGIKGGQHGAE